jgi:hypothetical protein
VREKADGEIAKLAKSRYRQSEYRQQLDGIASLRREKRLNVEARRLQIKRQNEADARQRAAVTEFEDQRQKNSKELLRQQQRADKAAALEMTLAERVAMLFALHSDLAYKVAALRGKCTALLKSDKYNFEEALRGSSSDSDSTAQNLLLELEAAIQYERVHWLCSNSPASYVSTAQLVCVCVCERERERERDRDGERETEKHRGERREGGREEREREREGERKKWKVRVCVHLATQFRPNKCSPNHSNT